MNSKKIIEKVLEDVANFNIDDIPNLDLYMDQVTTYLNKKFAASRRNTDDKLITKTMINNYTKGKLVPAPEKKKYSKDHVLALGLILFLKNALSISDVSTVMEPVISNNFQNEDDSLEILINDFVNYLNDSKINDSLLDEFENVEKIFENANIDDVEYIKTLGTIYVLCYDIFIRKIMVERLIDSISEDENEQKK